MKWLAIIILILGFNIARGQTLNKRYIDSLFVRFNPVLKGLPIYGYVLDGIFFSSTDSLKMNSVLGHWKYGQLLAVDGIKSDMFHEITGRLLVLVSSRGNQSRKQKFELYNKALSKYKSSKLYIHHIDPKSTEPVLLINDEEIFFADCYDKLSKIKVKSIYAINIYDHLVSTQYYGQNAKNGLIQIWTYSHKE